MLTSGAAVSMARAAKRKRSLKAKQAIARGEEPPATAGEETTPAVDALMDGLAWESVPIHQNLFLRTNESLAGLISVDTVSGVAYDKIKEKRMRSVRGAQPAKKKATATDGKQEKKRRTDAPASTSSTTTADDDTTNDTPAATADDIPVIGAPTRQKKSFMKLKSTPKAAKAATPASSSVAIATPATDTSVRIAAAPAKPKPASKKAAATPAKQLSVEEAAKVDKKKAARERKKARVAAANAAMAVTRPAKQAEAAAKKKADSDAKKAADEEAEEERALAAATAEAEVAAVDTSISAGDEWEATGMHPLLLQGVRALGFPRPTPIQAACLPAAIRDWRDVVGAAATGSGKTLAFGIPIVHHVMEILERKKEKAAEREARNRWKAKKDDDKDDEKKDENDRPLLALIICPTRELALQVSLHINAVAKFTPIKAIPIVGGMSPLKQQRLLDSRPQIVVSTPGRLWELITAGQPHLSAFDQLRFFVLDEADRMVANGHFPQLNHIIRYMETYKDRVASRAQGVEQFYADIPEAGQPLPPSMPLDYKEDPDAEEDDTIPQPNIEMETIDGDDNDDDEGDDEAETKSMIEGDDGEGDNEDAEEDDDKELDGLTEVKKPAPAKKGIVALPTDRPLTDKELKKARKQEAKQGRIDARRQAKAAKRHNAAAEDQAQGVDRTSRRQTFLFSATLMLPEQGREGDDKKKRNKRRNGPPSTMLDELADRMTFREDPLVIDLGTKQTVAEGLEEKRVDCIDSDKDYWLYYFLARRPGKTLVFVNAISCLRRLIALFTQLGVAVIPLHANLQQRQRLKNLDRFKANPRAVAICTDVAARGLDIQGVEYVVHYQLPRSSESYVHRCGRTARAGATGFSLALVGPKDQKSYRKICHVLNKEKGIPFMIPEQGYMEMIQDRVNLARKVDLGLNKLNKEQVQTEWLRKQAADCDLDLDENMAAQVLKAQVAREQQGGKAAKRKAAKDAKKRAKNGGKGGNGSDDEDGDEEEKERSWDEAQKAAADGEEDDDKPAAAPAKKKASTRKSKAERRRQLQLEDASNEVAALRREKQGVQAMQHQLRSLLAQPLVAKGVSRSFITRNAHIPLATSSNGSDAVDLENISRV